MNVSSDSNDSIRRRMRRLEREFESKGYQVLSDPEAEKLPKFLVGYQPNLIIHKPGETVIVEIASTAHLIEHAAQFKAVAREIQRHPGWRFEVVVTNPRRSQGFEMDIDNASISKRTTYIRLGQVQELLDADYAQAAFLLLGSAIEATIRLLACKEDPACQQDDAQSLLKQLFSSAVISRDEYTVLREALEEYIPDMHGLRFADTEPARIEDLIRITMQLLRI
jgi:DNA-binding Lrp family transcriptional regulator